jgi:hypothetical protein
MQVCCPLAGPTNNDGGDYHEDNDDNEDDESDEDEEARKRKRRTLGSASCKVQLHVSVLTEFIKVTVFMFSLLPLG